MSKVTFTHQAADFNALRTHRYCLERTWAEHKPKLVCVGVNPSVADEERPDATIRKVVGFADRWGFGGIVMVNLYAWVSQDPSAMKRMIREKGERYVIGEANDHVLMRAFSKHEHVWFAWGANGTLHRAEAVLALARAYKREPFCIGVSENGHPLHPLIQAWKSERRPWVPPAAA